MSLLSTIRRWLARPRPVTVRLAFESLEDRTAPAVIGQLRVVSYNILQVPDTTAMTTVLQAINDQTFASLTRDIDIILLQEVNNSGTDDDIIRNILNAAPGSSNQYVTGPLSGSDGTIRQGVVYNDAAVDFIGSQIISSSGPRDPIRYQFRPQGLDANYDFYIYNSHYDASDAPDRLDEAQNIRANADALGQGAEILFAGDYNIQSSSESMYTTLLAAGNGQAFDPINTPGTWRDNNSLKITHTQNPAGTGFVGGGMDDRFDFILHSQEVGGVAVAGDGTGLEFRAGSYRVFGNNGTHSLNGHINTGSGASAAVLNALGAASDHLPVVVDYDVVMPDVSFTTASQSGAENGPAMTITVQLSATMGVNVTVPFTLSGTATGGGIDYTITPSPITIPAGQTTGTITISPVDDALDEDNETVIVTMGTPTNAALGATTVHTATIIDDDPTPTVAFTATANNALESVATRTLTVQLSAASGRPVTVPYTVGGTATNPADYSISPASPLSFAPGETSKTITITVVDDTEVESDETVIVTLGTPTNGTLGANTVFTETIVDNDIAALLQVSAFTPTQSGFEVNFNQALDPADLNLYDAAAATLGLPDVIVTGPAGAVRGSLVVAPSHARVTFVATGGVLPTGSYTLTLRSAATGFKDTSGALLDGNGDGVAGGDYVTQFTVSSSSARVVSVPDFARGAGQPVNVPATGTGLPLRVSDAAGVTSAQADLLFDPDLLSIPAGTFPGGPFGSTLTITAITGGVRLMVTGLTGATGANVPVAVLTATVPNTAPYASKQVLDLENVTLNGGGIAARADDAVHLAAYFGDTNGSRTLTSGDTSLTSQLATGLGTGLMAYQLADPLIVADTNGSGTLTSGDASLLAQKAVGLTVSIIPDLPAGVTPPAGGPDPRLYLTSGSGRAGETVTIQLRMEVTERAGITLTNGDYAIRFDPTRLRVSNVRGGSMLPGFGLAVNVDNTAGVIRVAQYTATAIPFDFGADGDVILFDVTVLAGARPGRTSLNLLEKASGNGSTTWTGLGNDAGLLTLVPTPTDAPFEPVDGVFTVLGRRAGTGGGARPRLPAGSEVREVSIRLESGTLVFRLDPARFRVEGVTAGAMVSGFTARIVRAGADGVVVVKIDTANSIDFAPGADGELLTIAVRVHAMAPAGASRINLLADHRGFRTELNGSGLVLIPAPTNADDDAGIDDKFTVDQPPVRPRGWRFRI